MDSVSFGFNDAKIQKIFELCKSKVLFMVNYFDIYAFYLDISKNCCIFAAENRLTGLTIERIMHIAHYDYYI